MSLVQVKAAVRRQDDAPDATFSGTGKSSGESKEIVSIFTMLEENHEDEVKNGSKDEDTAQFAFQKQRDAANNLTASLEEKKTNLNDAKSDTEEKIHNTEDLQSDTEGLKGATEEELSEACTPHPQSEQRVLTTGWSVATFRLVSSRPASR